MHVLILPCTPANKYKMLRHVSYYFIENPSFCTYYFICFSAGLSPHSCLLDWPDKIESDDTEDGNYLT